MRAKIRLVGHDEVYVILAKHREGDCFMFTIPFYIGNYYISTIYFVFAINAFGICNKKIFTFINW